MKVSGLHIKKLGKTPEAKAIDYTGSESEKVCVSRDVVFEERKTWPWCQLDKDAAEIQVSAAQPLQQGV